MASQLRELIVDAAVELCMEADWSRVTMAALAQRVGISRQTIYNELGTKAQVAETIIAGYIESYVRLAQRSFEAHPEDPVGAIGAAANACLDRAENDRLLGSLAQLPTASRVVFAAATDCLADFLAQSDLGLTALRQHQLVDALVRIAASTVVVPVGSPQQAAQGIAWVAAAVLGLPIEETLVELGVGPGEGSRNAQPGGVHQ